jgi:paraquat-inducible protein A
MQHPLGSVQRIACPDCDALIDAPALHPGEKVVCPRCLALLFSFEKNSIDRTAAFAIAAAVLFVVSNLFPFLTLKAGFRASEMQLWQSVSGLVEQGYPSLAVAVAIFILGAPALVICGLLYLVLPLLSGRRLPGAIPLGRWVHRARRWNMVEVYLVSVIVSLLKLGKLATLTLGTSFWSFVALIVCLTAAIASIHPRELWARIAEARA